MSRDERTAGDDRRARLQELAVDSATGELSAEGRAELERLLAEHPDFDPTSLERAAAEFSAAVALETPSAMPAGVADAVADRLRAHAGGADRRGDAEGRRLEGSALDLAPDPTRPSRTGRRSGLVQWGGWIAAAAALAGWFLLPGSPRPERPAELSVADIRTEMTNDPAVLPIEWTATEDPAATGAGGSVLWSTDSQRGVMSFAGLAPNDPTRAQYQLWIFDATRDERYPVDGGVFDIPPGGGEVLVPIRPRIEVREPILFAVTVEAPGGVVVSDRERIVLVAQLD